MKQLFTLWLMFNLPFIVYADIFQVSLFGKLQLIEKTNDNYHILLNQTDNEQMTVPKEFIDRKKNFTHGNNQKGLFMGALEDIGKAIQIFKYLADKTLVEFGLSIFEFENDGAIRAYITTSFHPKENQGNPAVELKYLIHDQSARLLSSWHNHPDEENVEDSPPSGFDKNGSFVSYTGDALYYLGMKNNFENRIPKVFYLYDCNSTSIYVFNDQESEKLSFATMDKIIEELKYGTSEE